MRFLMMALMFSRPIILTVAKCWDPSPQGYFTLPRSEYTAAGLPLHHRTIINGLRAPPLLCR